MALTYGHAFSHIPIFVSLSIFLVIPSSCLNPRKFLNVTSYSPSDSPYQSSSYATFYGPPDGDGSEGGACGYGKAVGQPPFNSMISAGGPAIFKGGKGCGACYQVRCVGNQACSGNPVTIVITDECPGCNYNFDMSGRAFGSMAISGRGDQLRNAEKVLVQYRRVACNYPGVSITFRVDLGTNPYYFATLIEYEDGDGDLKTVEIKEANSATWESMQESVGAVWKLNKGAPMRAPFSIRLTTIESGKVFVANNVIPVGYKPGDTYRANGNFN
ncbi:putative expansin-B2 [Trifolium pratense]|uniref:putative expansin-B2 n=1 Tax=Trifolium pratense TaxID=57577 RepID=UPI001E696BFE|nr:putative expansin-B2 [Trifolium pratense]